jgi:hypothetical protein
VQPGKEISQMQNQGTKAVEDRVLQESHAHGDTRHVTGNECERLIRNAISLYPDLPAADLIEKLIALADPEFLATLDRQLRTQYLTHMMKTIRARDQREEGASAWSTRRVRASMPWDSLEDGG